METRIFGRTGMRLSLLGFGCGAVGGLMVRGDPRDQERTIARAIDVGVNYFDTAVQYGNGESEKNLGRILQSLKPANAVVGTKVRLPSAKFKSIADTVATSLEGSLARLSRDRVDIFHLHNAITESGGGEALSVQQVVGEVVPAFERLRQQGKTRFLGLTAVGNTAALHQVIDASAFDSAQVVYNMLNPSAATELPANYPAQDYGRLFDHTSAAGVGRRRNSRACRRRAIRINRAPPNCEPAARTDRLGYELPHRCLARPPTDAAGKRRICFEPDRSGQSLCDLTSGDRHYPCWYGNAPTIRGCARCGPKRPAAARRARAADDVTAKVRRRITVIYCDCRSGRKLAVRCPLLVVKRTCEGSESMSASDP